jgi:hypothetical protein
MVFEGGVFRHNNFAKKKSKKNREEEVPGTQKWSRKTRLAILRNL